MKRQYTEADIAQALEAIANGIFVQKAERDYGVPRSTLRGRLAGAVSHKQALELQQKLSKVQEEHLTKWVLTQESLGLCPTHTQIQVFANCILKQRGDNSIVGKR